MMQIALDQEIYNKIISSMRNVEKSEESLLKKAVNDTAKKAQRLLAKQANRVYGGEAPKGILERSFINKATVGRPAVFIHFRSKQPLLTQFRVETEGSIPTKTVYRDGKRVKFPIKGAQFKNGDLKPLRGELSMAFAVRFPSGKFAVVSRGTGTKAGRKGDTVLKAFYGSSDKAMVGNEKVYGKVNKDISDMLNQECEKLLDQVLGGK